MRMGSETEEREIRKEGGVAGGENVRVSICIVLPSDWI